MREMGKRESWSVRMDGEEERENGNEIKDIRDIWYERKGNKMWGSGYQRQEELLTE